MSKSKILCLVYLLFLTSFNVSFAQNWEWAIGGKGYDSFDYSNVVVVDEDGNVYIAGYFQSASLSFGDKKINNSGGEDIFVAKFDAKGNCLWNVAFGGEENEKATCMTFANGNLIVAGYFESKPANFGGKIANATSGSDLFVAIINPNDGTVSQLFTFGGDGYEDPNSIFVDNLGNIYLSGEFSGDYLIFGQDTLKNYNYGTIYKGMGDGFVAKLKPNGNFEWALRFGGVANDRVNSAIVDSDGMVYIYGTFNSNLLAVLDTVYNKGYSDIFLFKYDQNNKKFLWQVIFSGEDKEYPASIAIGKDGNIYLTGEFQSDVLKFPGGQFTNNGSYDFYIVKMDRDGRILKARNFGSYADEYAKKIVFDETGNFYIGGYFASISFNLDNFTLNNSSTDQYSDIFVAKFDADLNPHWGQSAGGKGEDQSFSIDVDKLGNVYQTGNFSSREMFFNKKSLFNFGYSNVFLAKLNPNLPLTVGIESSEQEIIIYPNPGGNYIWIAPCKENLQEKCKIFNLLGLEVLEFTLSAPTKLDISSFGKGIYLLLLGNKIYPIVKAY